MDLNGKGSLIELRAGPLTAVDCIFPFLLRSAIIDSNTRIFGQEGILDSMGLVTLITDLEEGIEDEFGLSLILADERAMSQKKSPFRTILSLTQHVGTLIEEAKQNERA